jgi:hypothetical protein
MIEISWTSLPVAASARAAASAPPADAAQHVMVESSSEANEAEAAGEVVVCTDGRSGDSSAAHRERASLPQLTDCDARISSENTIVTNLDPADSTTSQCRSWTQASSVQCTDTVTVIPTTPTRVIGFRTNTRRSVTRQGPPAARTHACPPVTSSGIKSAPLRETDREQERDLALSRID